MGRRIKMIEPGTRFGRLTVLGMERRGDGRPVWRCLCDCGNEAAYQGAQLRLGRAVSCGCVQNEYRHTAMEAARGKLAEIRKERRLESIRHDREELLAARRREDLETRMMAYNQREDLETRMMAYNQRAGMRFDDMWMFGDCHAIARLKTMFR